MAARSRRSRRMQSDEDEDTSSASASRSTRRGSRRATSAAGSRRSRKVEVEDGDSDLSASTSVSGRRSSRRSSARGSARQSSRKAKAAKSPEEVAARKRAIKLTVIWVLVIGVLGGGGAAAYIFLKEEPQTVTVPVGDEQLEFTGTLAEIAQQMLGRARQAEARVKAALSNDSPQDAEQSLSIMNDLLHRRELGGGDPDFDPEDPTIGSVQLARNAVAMTGNIGRYQEQIADLKDRKAAERNLARLKQRLAGLQEVEDLDGLERDLENFLRNPVEPEGEPDSAAAERFNHLVAQVEPRLSAIAIERQRRENERTTQVVRRVNSETQVHITEGRYSQAYEVVDRAAEEFPEADLSGTRRKIAEAATAGWERDRQLATSAYTEATSPGVPAARRRERLEHAIEVLEGVVRNYGTATTALQGYVREAERLLRDYRQQL